MTRIQHEIKIEKQHFERVMSGEKTFEIRQDDRGYQTGDVVQMNETRDDTGWSGSLSGRSVRVKIKYVSHYQQKEGWCVWGFEILPDNEQRIGYEIFEKKKSLPSVDTNVLVNEGVTKPTAYSNESIIENSINETVSRYLSMSVPPLKPPKLRRIKEGIRTHD